MLNIPSFLKSHIMARAETFALDSCFVCSFMAKKRLKFLL